MGKSIWEEHIEGFEQSLLGIGRTGDAQAVPGAFHDQPHGAQDLKLMETFLDGEIEACLSLAQRSTDAVGKHYHQHMSAGMLGGVDVNGTGFKMDGFASTKSHLGLGDVFVSIMYDLCRSGTGGQIGFYYIVIVQTRGLLQGLCVCLQ